MSVSTPCLHVTEFFKNINRKMASKLEIVNTLCRICLQEVQKPLNLFSQEENSKEILNKIYTCFQLILNFNNSLPSVICERCIIELNIAYKFRQNCITLEERFTKLSQQVAKNYTYNIYNETQEIKVEFTPDTPSLLEEKNSDNEESTADDINALDLKNLNKNGSFSCSICKKVLKTEISLQKHNISMHQKRKYVGKVTGFGADRRYHCTKCSYSTPHNQTLLNHMRKHNGDRPFQCECGKSFTQTSSLSTHRKTHSDTTYFTCSKCGKQFKHAFSLKTHLDVHESGKYNCSICHKQLKSSKTLHDHMNRHNNIRNYNCEDCGDTFVTCSELLNHKRKHNLIKTVECHLCGYKTHTKKSLIVHLKRHTGDKAYKCDLCNLTFYSNGDLQRHKRVHTKVKPFSCPTCTQKFTYSPSLNKHLKTVHGIDWKWSDIKTKLLTKENHERGKN